jgi:methylenetetrahydrofolate dehydrogenase (NADP+) / methenyltetrahydrofolate cyclohydrolase
MTAKIISGQVVAQQVKAELKQKISAHVAKMRRPPCLAVLLVGDDPASHVYVKHKEKACLEVGITSKTYRLPATVSQAEVLRLIHELNHDTTVDGILPQLPMPSHIGRVETVGAILPTKDVDGLSFHNQGKLLWNLPALRPCTPSGVMELLRAADVAPAGKQAVVIGRSILVGLPAAMMLTHAGATVTIVHSKTENPQDLCRRADILVAAAGVQHLVKKDWVKPNAVVIDVGIHRLENGSLTGDVDPAASDVAQAITPVPGGVGPMTIAMLLKNCLQAYESLHLTVN